MLRHIIIACEYSANWTILQKTIIWHIVIIFCDCLPKFSASSENIFIFGVKGLSENETTKKQKLQSEKGSSEILVKSVKNEEKIKAVLLVFQVYTWWSEKKAKNIYFVLLRSETKRKNVYFVLLWSETKKLKAKLSGTENFLKQNKAKNTVY